MKYLKMLTSMEDDLKVVKTACKKYGWEKQESSWMEAYNKYYESNGNPWLLPPAESSKEFSDQQYELYDKRKSGGPIKRIRERKKLLSCPVCGSSTTGDVDHYLPRKVYPEFSIMRANLVPSCTHCNSGGKGTHVKGVDPQRFIHPYFDHWADESIWHVEFLGPLKAAQFKPTPSCEMPKCRQEIVSYHLDKVIGEQFHRSMENKWSTLPSALNFSVVQLSSSCGDTYKAIFAEFQKAEASTGKNSWDTAFFRGLLLDGGAVSYIHSLRVADLICS